MDSVIVLRSLNELLNGNNNHFRNFDKRKMIICLRACCKLFRSELILKTFKINFNFSDLQKIKVFAPTCQIDFFRLTKTFGKNYNYLTDFSIDQLRFVITNNAYHYLYNGKGHRVIEKHDLFGGNPEVSKCYYQIKYYTPQNIYEITKLMSTKELMIIGF